MPKDPSSIMLKMLVGTWHKNKKLKHQKNYWRFSVVVVTWPCQVQDLFAIGQTVSL